MMVAKDHRELALQAGQLTQSEECFDGSRREQAKHERRGRIVKAAHDLLRETGVEELSMRAVADRADVSLSTVYNLFESKQAVLARVFDRDLADFEQLVAAAPSPDVLARMFDALDIAADLYQADPAFYRATMWRRPGESSELGLRATLRAPRIRFWRGMVAAAAQEGWLRRGSDPEVVGALLIQIFGGVLADWIAGEISIETLRRELKLGFAVTLLAFATRQASARLRTLSSDLHSQLRAARS
jgi:AcrR family transcriptional regulator